MLAGTEVSLPLLRRKASSIYQELHRRITALEEALRAASSSHPLLSTSHRSISVSSESGHLTSPNSGQFPSADRQSGDGAVDSLSGYSHLIVEEDPKRSKYYGAASSVYLTVSPISYLGLHAGGADIRNAQIRVDNRNRLRHQFPRPYSIYLHQTLDK